MAGFLAAGPSHAAHDYAIGADLSFLRQAEERGVQFKDGGVVKPGLQIFREHGYNWIRLRLFHTPSAHPRPLPNDLAYTIAAAQDAKARGFKFLLNYHYSDTWADPAKQFIPKAWENLDAGGLATAVHDYTRDTIAAFRVAGVMPDMVQVGNEITPGMLWPHGKLPQNWHNFAAFVQAGIRGVDAGRGDAPRPRIMIHIEKGGDRARTKWFFDNLLQRGVEFDVIGQSYYPWWHGSLLDLRDTLAFMAETYRKEIIVVEVAYNWRATEYLADPPPFPETPEGQRAFLDEVNRVVLATPHGLGKGVFWWEPAVAPTTRIASRGMFDADGNALPVISVFDRWARGKPRNAAGREPSLDLVSPDAFAGSSVNVVGGLQHTLFTHGDAQYAAFYGGDRGLRLARRALPAGDWVVVRTAFSADVNDAHRTVAIAVDGQGILHVAWDHHGNPLNYARGVGPGSLELGPRQPMTGRREGRVTYPQFLPLPDGDLLFFYRDGQSGRGNLVLNRYSVRTGTWTQVHASLIDGEGARSAYPAMTIDSHGLLHLAWVWRESPDVATNHDLCYARSADGGVSWTTSAGAPLAVPFTAATAEYALRLPEGRSLMNPPALAADAAGRPILANYWQPEGSDIPQYHVVHHNGTAWRVQQVTRRTTSFTLGGTATKRPPISRSVLLPVPSPSGASALHLVYREGERQDRIVAASCPDLGAAETLWTFRDLTADPVGSWEPSLDPGQAARGVLQMLVQRVEQRDGNDREAAAAPPTPIFSLAWEPPAAVGPAPAPARTTPVSPDW